MESNRISRQLKGYLEYKHSLGFKLTHEATVLKRFAAYTQSIKYDGPLTTEIVLKWVASGKQSDKTMGRKIEVIRPFSKYVYSFDRESEIIHSLIFKNVHERPTPYIYSQSDVGTLMDECQNLYSPDGIRSYTTNIIIGLLWSTGMRPSEPVNLLNEDVDFKNNTLHIRKTKFSKERYIPIHKSVTEQLRSYRQWIEEKLGLKSSKDPFFYTTGGKKLTESSLAYAFKLIRPCINSKPTGYPYVSLYDFRHTFACNPILRWNEQGEDVNEKLHVLSTYLGHVKPADTFWYLSETPELLKVSCSKYEEQFGGNDDEI